MATRLVLQTDKRSHNTFGFRISDTIGSSLTTAATNIPILVPDDVNLAMITVGGSIAYAAVNELPIIPSVAAFTFQPGKQINNGASILVIVASGDTLNIITADVASIEVSFYVNEIVN